MRGAKQTTSQSPSSARWRRRRGALSAMRAMTCWSWRAPTTTRRRPTRRARGSAARRTLCAPWRRARRRTESARRWWRRSSRLRRASWWSGCHRVSWRLRPTSSGSTTRCGCRCGSARGAGAAERTRHGALPRASCAPLRRVRRPVVRACAAPLHAAAEMRRLTRCASPQMAHSDPVSSERRTALPAHMVALVRALRAVQAGLRPCGPCGPARDCRGAGRRRVDHGVRGVVASRANGTVDWTQRNEGGEEATGYAVACAARRRKRSAIRGP